MSIGTMTLHRFNGDEIFPVEKAIVECFKNEEEVSLTFRADASEKPIKTLPDTETLKAHPFYEVILSSKSFDIHNFVGNRYELASGYDEETDEYLTDFYYCEHEVIDDNTIEVVEQHGDLFKIRMIGSTIDVNYYDGSKPQTKVIVEALFKIEQ